MFLACASLKNYEKKHEKFPVSPKHDAKHWAKLESYQNTVLANKSPLPISRSLSMMTLKYLYSYQRDDLGQFGIIYILEPSEVHYFINEKWVRKLIV